jgi:hypothetical protein
MSDGVAGVVDVEGSEALAGALDGVDVTCVEGHRCGLGEVDAGVLEAAVDEDRDRDQAGGDGFVELARPLVDGEGAGDLGGRIDLVGLGQRG